MIKLVSIYFSCILISIVCANNVYADTSMANLAWQFIDTLEDSCDTDHVRRSIPLSSRQKIPELADALVVIDASKLPLSCGYTGSAGSPLFVIGKVNGRWVRVFGSSALRSYKFTTGQGPTTLTIDLHGSACGKMGAATCIKKLRFNGRQFE
jgi:hypothetical protein